jgi:methylated-DNA-[protein]-cysteine S-methyltransferase
MNYQTWKSPVGRLHFIASDAGLHALAFDDNFDAAPFGKLEKKEHPIIQRTIRELEEYFAGNRREFSVPLAVQGTPFQKKAWAALASIPYGKTVTYREQAARLRKPGAFRAVGRANGLNRVCILVPCHRVVGSNGTLTGYAGGLRAKQKLLELEGENARR